uniref:Uncharacterized protein n=2 Tax=Musa acuminata subsp. malaccensis TaxID=214687 RepID=A0A804IKT0_MUSAM
GLWSPEEDEKLYNHINRCGVDCWSSSLLFLIITGLQCCGKSCRFRWSITCDQTSREAVSLSKKRMPNSLMFCDCWLSKIASQLPGRTYNEIKNFWNSCLKTKLR